MIVDQIKTKEQAKEEIERLVRNSDEYLFQAALLAQIWDIEASWEFMFELKYE